MGAFWGVELRFNSPSECFSSSVDLEKKCSLELAVRVIELSNQKQVIMLNHHKSGRGWMVKPKRNEFFDFIANLKQKFFNPISSDLITQTFSYSRWSGLNERSLQFTFFQLLM